MNTDAAQTSEFLTVSQAARTLGVHPNTIRTWTQQGVLPCLRINGRGDRRYRRADLAGFMRRAASGDTGNAVDAAEQARRADLLLSVGAELGRQLDPNLVLSQLVERTAEMFHADRAAVFTRTPAGTYRPQTKLNLSDEYCETLEHATSRPISAIAFEERRVVSIPDVTEDPRTSELRHAFRREGINTVTIAPLIVDGDAMGALCLYYNERHDWSAADLDMLQRLAEQSSMVVRNADNYNRMATWAAQLHSIQQLGTRLTRLRQVDEIGQTICTELNQLIACHNIRVYRVEGEECVPVAWRGEVGEYEDEDGEQLRLKVGEGITGWVARHGLAQNLGNAAADRRAKTIPGTEDDLDESLLLAPMLFDDEVIGVIVLAKLGLNQFGPDDLRVLEIYATIAAQAVANADATERLRAKSEALARQLNSQRELLRVTESILTTLDAQTLLEEIATRLQALIEFDNIVVSVHDAAARRLRTIFARGTHAANYANLDVADDQGIRSEAIRTGEAQLVQDQLRDPRVIRPQGLESQSGALIAAPLRSGEGSQGLLMIERLGEDARFSNEEFDLVKLFAGHVSIALRNAAAHRAVELRAETDPLTGLWNHGALTAQTERLVSLGSRFSMLMVDLDFFKRYNDHLGHQAGNAMLKRVANVLRDSCRDSDLVFRFGGDEFAVVLPQTSLTGARVVADKIKRAVERLGGDEGTVAVSCSVGMAVYPRDGLDANSVIIAADRACYAAKRGGRNRIATAAEGLILARDFRPTEPTSLEPAAPAYSAA